MAMSHPPVQPRRPRPVRRAGSGTPAAWPVGLVYVGAVVGAGFFSGRELLVFFGRFGPQALWGMGLATAGFFVVALVLFGAARRRGAPTYAALLLAAAGRRVGSWLDLSLVAFWTATTGVMVAAGGALMHEYWGLPTAAGRLATAAAIAVAVAAGSRGVLVVNSLTVPALTLVGVALGLRAAARPATWQALAALPNTGAPGAWVLAALLYVTYNAVLAAGVLVPLGNGLDPGQAARAAAVGAGGLGALAAGITLACLAGGPAVWQREIPLLAVAGDSPALRTLTVAALWVAILTTGVANAFAVGTRLKAGLGWPDRHAGLAAVAVAYPMARAGFAALVGWVYPLMGLFGLLPLAYVTIDLVRGGRR